MPRDPFEVLLKIRRRSVDYARQQVASCMESERRTISLIQVIDEQSRRDAKAGADFPDAWKFEDMFAGARMRDRERRKLLMNQLGAACTRTEAARHGLSLARMAAEAVEQLIEVRDAAARQEAEKRQQHALDDIARALWIRRQTGAARLMKD